MVAVKTRVIRKIVGGCSVALTLYVISYCLDSFFGGYWEKPEMDGRDRYSFGLAIPTAILWQPRWGHLAIGDYDFLGMSYAPLIWLDRMCVHRTLYVADPAGFDRASHLSRGQIHPDFRAGAKDRPW